MLDQIIDKTGSSSSKSSTFILIFKYELKFIHKKNTRENEIINKAGMGDCNCQDCCIWSAGTIARPEKVREFEQTNSRTGLKKPPFIPKSLHQIYGPGYESFVLKPSPAGLWSPLLYVICRNWGLNRWWWWIRLSFNFKRLHLCFFLLLLNHLSRHNF